MDEGGVLFCSRTEVYFGLNQVGVKIWEQLPQPGDTGSGTFEELVAVLEQSYPDVDRETLIGDASEFLQAMAESELVTYDDASAP
jgi:hypothetical protein